MVREEADAQRLREQGCEAVLADFDDPGSLGVALTGARAAHLVTPSSERAETQQLHFVEEAARAGARHLVVLSQLGASLDSPVRCLRHHAVVEERVRALGLPFTFLRPDLFSQGPCAFRADHRAGPLPRPDRGRAGQRGGRARHRRGRRRGADRGRSRGCDAHHHRTGRAHPRGGGQAR